MGTRQKEGRTMSKKDYVRAAQIVNDVRQRFNAQMAGVVYASFATFFKGENSRFDADRFASACGM
jgi:hypothetical protein